MRTTREETLYQEIQEILDQLDKSDIFDLWNRYCQECNCPDDEIFLVDDFDEFLSGMKPFEVLRSVVALPEYDADIWWYDGYGNIRFGQIRYLGEDYDKSPCFIGDIADYMARSLDPMGVQEIEDLFNRDQEEEDEEE